MVRQAKISAMVVYHILMYIPIGWSPMSSIAPITKEYYHSPHAPRFSVIPVIRRAYRWWNPSRTLIISSVTTRLSLPYNMTDCNNALYIYTQARTIYPVFFSTLTTITHHL